MTDTPQILYKRTRVGMKYPPNCALMKSPRLVTKTFQEASVQLVMDTRRVHDLPGISGYPASEMIHASERRLIWFCERLTWNRAESLVCDVPRRLNVLHQTAPCFSRFDRLKNEATWCSTSSRLVTSQRRDSAGFQASLLRNQIRSIQLRNGPFQFTLEKSDCTFPCGATLKEEYFISRQLMLPVNEKMVTLYKVVQSEDRCLFEKKLLEKPNWLTEDDSSSVFHDPNGIGTNDAFELDGTYHDRREIANYFLRMTRRIVSTETCGRLIQHIQLLENVINERFRWVPGESHAKPNLFEMILCILVSSRPKV
ncbi:hypothetical protein T265_04500 [Opisthorchis viverrini]|uniref:Uncharacterized protein n=1 Tax=Opisthorchis viverrini TaxID=6198 RepID=A0A074ZNP1_OPIVI|nr:hypothetical protein T265_04500 [Opisthorchis viverrini]KER28711.1 hypothetical protein T265_04500 [Opisthorchis viverrini]